MYESVLQLSNAAYRACECAEAGPLTTVLLDMLRLLLKSMRQPVRAAYLVFAQQNELQGGWLSRQPPRLRCLQAARWLVVTARPGGEGVGFRAAAVLVHPAVLCGLPVWLGCADAG